MSVVSIRKRVDTTKYKEGICRIGFFEDSKYEGGKPVAFVAMCNEYGLGVPMRPFMRPALHENRSKIIAELRSQYRQALKNNKNTMLVLEIMGEKVKGLVQEQIAIKVEPANAPSTIKRKGFNKPLIETGIMFASVRHQEEEVRK